LIIIEVYQTNYKKLAINNSNRGEEEKKKTYKQNDITAVVEGMMV